MKTLSDMTVTEAASLAIELILYGDWDNQKNYSWRTAREGTFEEYLDNYISSDVFEGDEYYDEEKDQYVPATRENVKLDDERIWQGLHGEGSKGEREGWTGELVKSHGGEGQGDQYWMVISVSDGKTTRHFRKDGWYASYDGGYLDGETYEVKPVERLVTYYEE